MRWGSVSRFFLMPEGEDIHGVPAQAVKHHITGVSEADNVSAESARRIQESLRWQEDQLFQEC